MASEYHGSAVRSKKAKVVWLKQTNQPKHPLRMKTTLRKSTDEYKLNRIVMTETVKTGTAKAGEGNRLEISEIKPSLFLETSKSNRREL